MLRWPLKLPRSKLIASVLFLALIGVLLLLIPKTKQHTPVLLHTYIQSETVEHAPISETTAEQYYNQWKQTYIATDSASQTLRVFRPEDYNDTVSEGIATGMLAAVAFDDKKTFDGLWTYAKEHKNNHGLMAWHISATGSVLDTMAASDADEDMAYALIAADTKWGGYKNDATALLSNIMSNEVEQNTYVLKPGDTWGGSDVLSPSYISPIYYDVFAKYTGDSNWENVKSTGYGIIDALSKNTSISKTGLIPDWTTADGSEVTVYTDKDYIFGYKSVNAVWRLALAANWEKNSSALTELQNLSQFFKSIETNNIVDGYSVDGVDMGGRHYSAFVDTAIIAAQYGDDAYKKQMTDLLISPTLQHSFYADTYMLITSLVLSNTFPRITL